MHMTTYSMAAILQNDDTADLSVYLANRVGFQHFSYGNTLFCSNKFAWLLDTLVNTLNL